MTRYIEERRETFGVEPICSAIGVPVSTHYARRSRKPSARELADRRLLAEIEEARSGRDDRLHEALGDLPPAEYEELNIKTDNIPMVAAT